MSKERDHYLLDPFVAQSGMFLKDVSPLYFYGEQPAAKSGECNTSLTMFNVLQPEVANEKRHMASEKFGEQIHNSFTSANELVVIDQAKIDDYGDTLYSKISPSVMLHSHDVMIFPLRGARQPGILHKAVANLPDEQIVVLAYTNWSNSTRSEEIYSDLKLRLRSMLQDRTAIKIGVLDTAVGGHGSNNLARMLVALHDEAWQGTSWHVHFHLIHRRSRYPEMARRLEDHSTDTVVISKSLYDVADLIFEDWSEGIGLDAIFDGTTYRMKRLTVPGTIAVKNADVVTVIESESLSDQITQLLADSVNESVFTDEGSKYVKDVWNTRDEGRIEN